MSTELPRDFKGIWICKELWTDNRLTHLERGMMAEIDSLDCGAPHHCFARNEHFEKMFNSKERTISQAITKLKRLGFVEVVSFDGRKRSIKSNLKTIYAIFYGSESQPQSSKQFFTGQTSNFPLPSPIGESIDKEIPIEIPIKDSPIVLSEDPISSIPKNSREHDTNTRKLGTNPRARGVNPRKTAREEKVEKRPRVWICDSQQQDLLRRLNGDEKKVNACYDRLSAWKIDKMIDGGKSDYGSIVKWVIDAVEKEWDQKSTTTSKPMAISDADNRTWWNGLAKILGPYEREGKIYTGSEYVEFSVRGNLPEKLYFKDAKFQEVAKSYLKKLQIFV